MPIDVLMNESEIVELKYLDDGLNGVHDDNDCDLSSRFVEYKAEVILRQ